MVDVKDGEEDTSGRLVGNHLVISRIGAGNSGVVWRAEHAISGRRVALKWMDLSTLNSRLRDSLDCELAFLAKVDHPNTIRLIEVFELCAGGDLSSYIQRNGMVSEQTAKAFLRQLAAGYEVLHAHHVIHRDLKPEVICRSFNYYRTVGPGDITETVCGSPLYMAPEILQFQKYDEKVDLWSLGVIVFELLNGYPPLRGRNHVQVLQGITISMSLPFSELILAKPHPDCMDICTRLLCKTPDKRLSFEEFYHHKFLNGGDYLFKSDLSTHVTMSTAILSS
ncbi:unnamed protein product [Victoria cruziana]